MEQIEKLLPFIALIGVGACLLFLLQLARHERGEQQKELRKEANTTPIAVPVEMPLAMPVVGSASEPTAEPLLCMAPKTVGARSPIISVIDLITQKDTLAGAFILNEVLAPPVSRRQRKKPRRHTD